MRPHVSLDVRNVPASVRFYQKVFGVGPQKQTIDYAKFDLAAPPLNLSLVSSAGKISSVDHLGIEVESIDEVTVWKERFQEQGILEKVEENIACCFARQDKVWFSDPDGNAWEVFTVHEQLEVTGPLSTTGCCVPRSHGATEPATCAPTSDTSKAEHGKDMPRSRTLMQAVVGLLLLALTAPLAWGGDRTPGDRYAAGVPAVFVAHDYAFAGPDRVPAGMTTVQILN